jgi:hypothetical protein
MHRRHACRVLTALTLAASLGAVGCESSSDASNRQPQSPTARPQSSPTEPPSPSASTQPGTADADLASGAWVRAAGDFANTRYSPLTDITSGNARQL